MLGCLVEKQRTTPDQYPLSLNALRLACNQATNRDPVVDYDEAEIRRGARPALAPRLGAARERARQPRRQVPPPARRGARPRPLADRAARRADAPRPADAGRAEAARRAALSVWLDRGRRAGARGAGGRRSWRRSCRAGRARARTAGASCSAATAAGAAPFDGRRKCDSHTKSRSRSAWPGSRSRWPSCSARSTTTTRVGRRYVPPSEPAREPPRGRRPHRRAAEATAGPELEDLLGFGARAARRGRCRSSRRSSTGSSAWRR